MKIRLIIIIFALLILLSTTVGGYLFYYSVKESAITKIHNDAETNLLETVDRVNLSLSEFQNITAVLAGHDELQQALVSRNYQTLTKANAILDLFQQALNVDVCYLIDRTGTTIASSNRKTPESFMGKNYAFRPYFQQAMAGEPYLYPALGAVTKKRGIFYSRPVYGRSNSAPAGVVVIKASILLIEKEINKKYDGVMMLVDPQGVVFVSSHADWLLNVLWERTPEELSRIAKTRQFGRGPFGWTGMKKTDEHHSVDQSGNDYRIHQAPVVSFPGWNIIYLHDLGIVSNQASGLLVKNISLVFLLFSIVTVATSVYLFRKASTEILKRRQAEDDLRSTRDRLQALVKASPLPIVIIDAAGKILLWNPAAEQVFGWTEQEMLGNPLQIIPADRKDEFLEIQKSIFRGEVVKATEAQRIRKDGSRIDISLSAAPLHDGEGAVIAGMGIFEDITDRKKMEVERLRVQTLQSIGILAGGIAHDFNNLLSVITGNIHLAKTSLQLGDKAFSKLNDAENVCEIAGELSTRLITFATGGDPIKRTMHLAGLVTGTVNAALKGSTVHAEFDLSESLHAVAIDEGQMQQVFHHLAINAKEAMPHGGTLSIRGENIIVSAQDNFPIREDLYLKIAVRDTGAGIPEENLARIFDPYYSTKDTFNQKGLGLGLAVCYSVIKKHGGLITVESQVGEGTTFLIYLPSARRT
jgi:PAS domain S-box-containing protein